MNNILAIQHSKRILGVFAHPDDESFCAGGTFAKYIATGAEVMVVSATRGEAGQIRMPSVASRLTLGAVRQQELHLACQRLGIQHARCLDHRDGTLKDVDQEVLTRQVTEIIRTFRPDVVITFGPDGGYGHPDHIAISAATTAACLLNGDSTEFPEQIAAGLAAHQPARLYHSLFPRNHMLLLERLVEWLGRGDEGFCGTVEFARALLLLSEASTLLGYINDYIDVSWYPAGFYIVEQGESAVSLYLILSGEAEAIREGADGTQQVLGRLKPGAFFGEEGVAYGKPRNAHVIAVDNVTCLVFSQSTPTAFLGRGKGAHITGATEADENSEVQKPGATTCIDVSSYIEQKIAALAAHRSQCPIEPEMLPISILQEMMGQEYFARVYPTPEIETELLPSHFPTSSLR